MKLAVIIVAAFTLSACSAESGPDAPAIPDTPGEAPRSSTTFLWGMVVNEAGGCIAGASVRVVRGQRAGESITQSTPCGAWDYDGGFFFMDLTPGVEMTLRASALGYADLERTLTPSLGPQMAHLFVPSRQ